jgi:hypothetical protein
VGSFEVLATKCLTRAGARRLRVLLAVFRANDAGTEFGVERMSQVIRDRAQPARDVEEIFTAVAASRRGAGAI